MKMVKGKVTFPEKNSSCHCVRACDSERCSETEWIQSDQLSGKVQAPFFFIFLLNTEEGN